MKNQLSRIYWLVLSVSTVFVVLFCASCRKKDAEEPSQKGKSSLVSTYYPFPGTVVFETNSLVQSYTAQSPSILVLPTGEYLGSFFYDGGTSVSISMDKGKTWKSHSRVYPSNFANLFAHNGAVYLMGTSKGGRADIAIYKSTDKGKTWSTPSDANTGLLLKGMFHTAPVPVVKHDGKIWRAYEEIFGSADSRDFFAFAMYADEDADLLKASSWKRTNSIRFDEKWINARRPNWLEGNMVVTPEGKLINFLRLETWSGAGIPYNISGAAVGKPRNEIAAVIDINSETMKASFKNDVNSFVHFPGAETKFTIRYDAVSKKYWTLTNKITSFRNTTGTHDGNWHQRNLVVLMSSTDLKDWKIERKVLRWNEGAHLNTWDTFGFQYIDWEFDGDDLVFLSRTSWYGERYHDANMITFHRVDNFRSAETTEPDDWIKYTMHPKLLDISTDEIQNGDTWYQDFNVQTVVGAGLSVDEQGRMTLANQQISADENHAMKALRFVDFKISHRQKKHFSLETLSFATSSNSGAFRVKWMYSLDGITFHPITNYLQLVENESKGEKLDPPLYLPFYKGLNRIDGGTGVILRCAIVRGNGSGIYMKLDNTVSIGGRLL